jgi:hypothetical protein
VNIVSALRRDHGSRGERIRLRRPADSRHDESWLEGVTELRHATRSALRISFDQGDQIFRSEIMRRDRDLGAVPRADTIDCTDVVDGNEMKTIGSSQLL